MPETRAPWHHWPIAILSLLFYGVGALDYVFTKLKFGFYLQNFTAEQVTYFTELPLWLNVIWAVAVWGGLAGSWLLWRRNRFSVLLLFAGFAALTFLTVWLAVFTRPTLVGVTGFLGLYLMAGTSALSFLIYVYARWERTSKKL